METAGGLGWTEDAFWRATPRYFVAATRGYRLAQQERWEQARYTGYLAIVPHTKKNSQLRPTDCGEFPWEKQARVSATKKIHQDMVRIWAEMVENAKKETTT